MLYRVNTRVDPQYLYDLQLKKAESFSITNYLFQIEVYLSYIVWLSLFTTCKMIDFDIVHFPIKFVILVDIPRLCQINFLT